MSPLKNRITLNRNELSGAFGDIGTDLPLVVGMMLASNFSISGALIVYGILQVLTALIYGIPMPVQPLKAVALIVITQKLPADVIWGGGLAIGIIMLFLTVTGLVSWLGKVIPKTVVRGIQLGLGIQLCLLAMRDYVPAEKITGYVFAFIGFIIGIIFIGNRKYPPAIFILLLGIVYIVLFKMSVIPEITFVVPKIQITEISYQSVISGLILLALPQIPLSLGNSIFATDQLVKDLFPQTKISIKKIGLTYSIMNIISALLGSVPVCHGSGGIAGHHAFGGRTGGSTFIYGIFWLLLGLLLCGNSVEMLQVFPKPILGIILIFEGISLIIIVKDIIVDKKMFFIAILVAVCANGLPNGYFIGMVLGTVLYYLTNKWFLNHFGKHE